MGRTKLTDEELLEKLQGEKGKILWSELKRFFATGATVGLSGELDIVEIAFDFVKDNKDKIEGLMKEEKIAKVTNEQANAWFSEETVVWAIVVSPWVLVQKV
ncbi:MAG: DUF2288 family protein [Nitrospinota bacterium]